MRVAVLCGGRSHERAVSLRSGARVEEALRELGHEPLLVEAADDDLGGRIAATGADVVFLALHGRGGEDGDVQRLFEQLGVAYTGARPGPAEAAFDKVTAKRTMLGAGVPTPPFITLAEESLEQFGADDAFTEARDEVGLPAVVKPARGGSSLGTRFVEDEGELPRALIGAFSYARRAIVERHVAGRELAVTVVGDPAAESGTATAVRTLPAVEIVPRQSDWFDYESRYEHGQTEFTCPPEGFDDDTIARVQDVARAAYVALDCSGFGRVDLIVDADGTPWVLELATTPGLTDTSIVPMACVAAGSSFPQLVQELLADALARHRETVESAGADSERAGDLPG